MSDGINIILVTHNARMRCFLEDYFKESMDGFRKYVKPNSRGKKEIRFKNSAILLLRNYDGDDIDNRWRLELVNEGQVTKARDGAYFVTPTNDNCQCDNTNIIFKGTDSKFIVKDNINENSLLKTYITGENKKYNIYIIRHGDALHNTGKLNRLKNFSKRTDTSLTTDGKEQAKETGRYFVDKQIKNIHYLFSSNLKRTRETLDEIINIIKQKNILSNNIFNIPDKIIVLPCSHELKYYENGSCDAKEQKSKFIPFENKMGCELSKVYDTCDTKDNCCKTTNDMEIDWKYYKKNEKNNNYCIETNMINEIFNFINNNHNDDVSSHDPGFDDFDLRKSTRKSTSSQFMLGGNNYKHKYLKYKYKYLQEKNRLLK